MIGLALAALTALTACDPAPTGEAGYQLTVRAPARGTLVIEDQAVPLLAERRLQVGGLGPPPWTATFMTADAQLTVMGVTEDGLDLVRLLQAPEGRPGNLIRVPIRRGVDDDLTLVGIANGRVLTADDDAIALPANASVELWGLWRRDGRLTGLSHRRLGQASTWSGGITLSPNIPADGRTDVQLSRAPAGWVQVELTIDGLRTGLILGEGLASADEAIRVRRPSAETVPDGGLWISARAPAAELDVHLPLDTPQAGLVWGDDPQFSPRPGPVDAGSLLGRERPLRWEGAEQGLLRARFEASDGCVTQSWQIIAPGDANPLDLPVPPGLDPLTLPSLHGEIAVDVIADVDYRDRLSGALGSVRTLPRQTSRRALRRVTGTWRGGASACETSPAQGTWYAYPADGAACVDGDAAPVVIIDRCGAVVPQPADPALCGRIDDGAVNLREGGRLPLVANDDGWRIGARWQLVPPTTPQAAPPPELVGDWHRASVSEQRRERGADGPGPATESALLLASGAPADGPWANLSEDGRLTITLNRRPLQAALLSYDGSEAAFAIDGGACRDAPRSATGWLDPDGALIIEEWLPEAGVLRRWTLNRQ